MLEAAAFLLLGLSIIFAILYLLVTLSKVTSVILEMQAQNIGLENDLLRISDNLDAAAEALSYEIDSLRKRCDTLEM